jgi:hypothetical protein
MVCQFYDWRAGRMTGNRIRLPEVDGSSECLDRTYTRCHQIRLPRRSAHLDPSHPRLHGVVHQSYTDEAPFPT